MNDILHYCLDNIIKVIVIIITLIFSLIIEPISFIISNIMRKKRYDSLSMNQYYNDKVILVTGSSSGIGESIVKQLMQLKDIQQMTIIISGRNISKLQEISEQCKNLNSKITIISWVIDLENNDSIEKSFELLQSELMVKSHNKSKIIDILINNAGVSSRGSALETSMDSLKKVISTNFYATVILTKLVVSNMIESKKNDFSISVITSIQGKLGLPYRTAYSSSKHAIVGYFDGIRGELRPFGISTTIISPGYVKTGLSYKAINGDGSLYNKMDTNTEKGMDSNYVGKRILISIANKDLDVMIADVKSKAAAFAKNLLPDLIAKAIQNRK